MISIVTLTCGTRTLSLKKCIESILKNTENVDYELIIVDNNSCPDTRALLGNYSKLPNFIWIPLPENLGVCARNKGLSVAQGDIIVQIDDDVIVHQGWDKTALKYFSDPKVGAVGVQGSYFKGWLDWDHSAGVGDYVDFLTGFFWAFRNTDIRYDEKLGQFWHEESEFQLQMKYRGFRFKKCEMVCTHASARQGNVDWKLHDANLNYVIQKWKDKEKELGFERTRAKEML
jgi:GT2 family glycosyltransferase